MEESRQMQPKKGLINERWLFIPLVLMFLSPCLLCAQFFFTDCWILSCPQHRDFELSRLAEIPSFLFPEETTILYTDQVDEDVLVGVVGKNVLTAYLGNNNGIAVYWIERFRTEKQAQQMLEAIQKIDPDLTLVEDINYKSRVADEFFIRCGEMELKGWGCELLARYDEYFVSFNTSINEHMTEADFTRIIVFLDKRMEMHFEK